MRVPLTILYWAVYAYSLLLLVRVILSWVRPRENRFTVLLYRVTEPLLAPIRRLMARLFPRAAMTIDFSPVVLMLILHLVSRVLGILIARTGAP